MPPGGTLARLGTVPLAALALALLAGCMTAPEEYVPRPDDLLPEGYVEGRIPSQLEALMSLGPDKVSHTETWMRGFKWNGDWEATAAHVAAVLEERGYHTIPVPLPKETADQLDRAGINLADVGRGFESDSKYIKVLLLNLKLLRDRGAKIETSSSDYFLVAARDQMDYGGDKAPAGG
jgi:hypothetical protein